MLPSPNIIPIRSDTHWKEGPQVGGATEFHREAFVYNGEIHRSWHEGLV